MTRHRLIRAAGFLGPILFVASATFAGGFKVVVHPANSISSIPASELSEYLLKRKPTWPDGKPVVPVDLPENSAVRIALLRDVFRRSENAIKNYWHQQIFSGRAVPPVQKASDQEVVAFVLSSPGAIGYVSESAHVGKLTVLTIR